MSKTTILNIRAKRRSGDFEISPIELHCAACASKFFDTCGSRDNAARLNQLFLDSLSIEIPDSSDTSLGLRFCPPCTLRLLDLDSLLTELENLQIRIQNVKDYICSTVTNAAFLSRNQPQLSRGGEICSAVVTSIREQVIQNWLAVGRNESQVNGSNPKQSEASSKTGPTSGRPDFECDGQNGLEIFDQIEQQEDEDTAVDDYDSNADSGTYVTVLTEAEESGPAHSIKIEPASWDVIESTEPFTGASLCQESMQIDSHVIREPSGQSNVENCTVYFDEDEDEPPNGIDFRNHEPVGRQTQVSRTASVVQNFFRTTSRGAIGATTHLNTRSNHPVALKSPPNIASKERPRNFEVEMCTLCYKYVAGGVRHVCGDKSSTTMYQCGYCNAVFHSERVLKEHVRRHINVDGSNRFHTCKSCKLAFPTPAKLAHHVKMEHGTDTMKCQLCPKTFKDISLFRIHMIAHARNPGSKGTKNQKSNFSCQFCGKGFRLNNDLRRHLLIHTGERPFRCQICPKAFNRKHHLTTHQEVHRKSQNEAS